MKVVFAGWFGSGNLGDEMLLSSAIQLATGTFGRDVEVEVIAAVPSRVAALHGVAALGMPVLRSSERRARRDALVAALSSASLLVLGPGTVFQERSPVLKWPGTLVLFARLARTARSTGTPTVVFGAGVREGTTLLGRLALRYIARRCSHIAVRDRDSASVFGGTARAIGDLVMALPVGDVVRPAAGPGTVAVSFRPLRLDVEGPLAHAIVDAVGTLTQAGWDARFVPMALGFDASGEDDMAMWSAYFAHVPLLPPPVDGEPLSDTLTPWLAALARHELMIAIRLHAALTSVVLGVPTVAIAYERKISTVFAMLGLSEFVLPVDATSEMIAAAARHAIASPEAFAMARQRVTAIGDEIRTEWVTVAGSARR